MLAGMSGCVSPARTVCSRPSAARYKSCAVAAAWSVAVNSNDTIGASTNPTTNSRPERVLRAVIITVSARL